MTRRFTMDLGPKFDVLTDLAASKKINPIDEQNKAAQEVVLP